MHRLREILPAHLPIRKETSEHLSTRVSCARLYPIKNARKRIRKTNTIPCTRHAHRLHAENCTDMPFSSILGPHELFGLSCTRALPPACGKVAGNDSGRPL
ncbi:sigma-54 dependent transcriptional regulator [Treponema pallidum subsp. pallidum]|nr:sigma-54 dependent transcriptional regulator [Treponema pallidum subsp. pallidum str. Mexico A]AGN75301.1 sigma-54 dependent transcriptional regulator [Treponema pallidum subsp. pallidum str. Nichols]AGN76278.1 sigma-54 dependent transcriptional regulator [Treponema pallidum subsp. pallidum SS14]AVW88135.1 sigma-54 dependent transcriptional regulator [Treponema pallidum subsp. pallidum]QCP88456.1 sigma-54 dependent transcriptional regulator [Treponema pallidum subsp. pallidum]